MTPKTPKEALDSVTMKPTRVTGTWQLGTVAKEAILAALKPWLMVWRTDEPPQDGQHIIVWDAVHGFALRARFNEGSWVSEIYQWSGCFKYWMPDIKPPQVTK